MREEDEAVAGADRLAGRACAGRAAPRPQREAREPDDHERQGVDGEREPQQSGGAEHAAEQRAGREAERAHRLHQPVGARDAVLAGCCGHERELSRLADRDAEAEQRHQRQHRPQRVHAEGDRDDDGCLGERDADQERPVLETVDDRAREARAQYDRTPEREEDRGDRERRAGALLHVQDERDDGEEVAQRRQAGGAGQQAEVAAAGDRHGGDRRGRPFAHRSACVKVP